MQAGLAASLLVGLLLAVLTLVLAVVLVLPIYGSGTAELVALTTPWFLMGAIAALPMATLRRRLDFRRLSILALAQSAARSIGSVVFAAGFGMDASALVLGGLLGMVATVVLAIAFAPVPLPRWRTHAIRDLLPYGGPASIASFAWAGFRNGDYAVIGATLGTAQAGFYWRGFQLAVEYQTKVSAVMTQMAFPVFARTEGADAMFALRRRMVRLLDGHGVPGPRPARRHRAGSHPVAVRAGVGAGGAAHPDPRRRGGGHRRDRRRRHGAHGRRRARARC